MTELEVLNVVRAVLIDSLQPKITVKMRHRDVWLNCDLRRDLYATEPEDYVDIAFRLNRALNLALNMDEIRILGEKMYSLETVGDLNSFVYKRLWTTVAAT